MADTTTPNIDAKPAATLGGSMDLTPEIVRNSVAIKRLIEEVRNDEATDHPTGYNRVYHRHNR
jgi:hypothetical protein